MLGRIVAVALALVLFALMLWVPVLWIQLGFEEGFWEVLFLQTEKSRSLALRGSAIMAAIIVGCLIILVVASLVSGRSKSEKDTGSDSENDSTATTKPRRQSRERSPRRDPFSHPWVIRGKGFLFCAFGVVGLFIEYSKPADERVWWVCLAFLASVGFGFLELLTGKE